MFPAVCLILFGNLDAGIIAKFKNAKSGIAH